MPQNEFLSPHTSPSRQNLSKRRSATSLHGEMDSFGVGNGQHSLAHELAAALLPEPSAGSKLLAEEFGIEYDEGAEGIDEDPLHDEQLHSDAPQHAPDVLDEYDPAFESPTRERQPEQDAMQILAQDLESTDKFLSHLRSIDLDGLSQQPSLERIAAEVIRRIEDSTRDREGQVRELLEYEREFRKIAGEVGGGDVLAQLDELDGLVDPKPSTRHARSATLDSVDEDPMSNSQEWEVDPDRRLGDDDEDEDIVPKHSLPPGPPTPATTIPHLAHLRSFTTSLVTSLTTLSEHAQVNSAATTEAGRKIRALKNKLGDWRTDWNSAEQSQLKIEKWETETIRMDGRQVVQEHLQAFERALADAAIKTQAIMAAS